MTIPNEYIMVPFDAIKEDTALFRIGGKDYVVSLNSTLGKKLGFNLYLKKNKSSKNEGFFNYEVFIWNARVPLSENSLSKIFTIYNLGSDKEEYKINDSILEPNLSKISFNEVVFMVKTKLGWAIYANGIRQGLGKFLKTTVIDEVMELKMIKKISFDTINYIKELANKEKEIKDLLMLLEKFAIKENIKSSNYNSKKEVPVKITNLSSVPHTSTIEETASGTKKMSFKEHLFMKIRDFIRD